MLTEIFPQSDRQRWAPVLFLCFRARECKAKTRAQKHQEKRAQKKRKRWVRKKKAQKKKARIRAFSSPRSGNPVSEPKAAREGESKGLEQDVQFSWYVMSHSGCYFLAVLSFSGCQILSRQSYPACPVLLVLFCLSFSACPVIPALLCMSCSAYSVLPILLCLPYSACPVLPDPFCLSYSACLSCSDCPVLPVLSAYLTLPVLFRLPGLSVLF
jgi:hypothetical protein